MKINENKLPIVKRFYSGLSELFHSKMNSVLDEDQFLLDEETSGPEFYKLVSSQGYQKEELFKIEIPIEMLSNTKFKKPRTISIETEIPIDTSILRNFMDEYTKAREENGELYQKYKKMAYWYTDFNKLMLDHLSESDAYLFLVAAAYCSSNTALDVNIIEATKLFRAVKIDFKRGNLGQALLRYLATNIANIDKQANIDKLAKIGQANSSFLQLLSPKKDPMTGEQFREITVSGSKLKNFNDFIIYYLDHDGKITKDELITDIKTGKLPVGGTKIYSFLMNLVDPNFEWVEVNTSDFKGGKIQPATIDRWMIRVFFDKPLNIAMKELIKDGIVEGDVKTIEKFKNVVIMKLFMSDMVRSNVVKLMNEVLKENIEKHPETTLRYAHQLQAFGWVRMRDKYDVPSADFSSFEDVMNFTEKTSDKIDQINPQLNFIKDTGTEVRNRVMTAIKLLSNIPRPKMKNAEETEKSIKHWLDYYATFDDKPKSTGPEHYKMYKYLITKPIKKDDSYTADIKVSKKVVHTVVGDTPNNVIRSAKQWVRGSHDPDAIPKVKKVKKAAESLQEYITQIILNEDTFIDDFIKNELIKNI